MGGEEEGESRSQLVLGIRFYKTGHPALRPRRMPLQDTSKGRWNPRVDRLGDRAGGGRPVVNPNSRLPLLAVHHRSVELPDR